MIQFTILCTRHLCLTQMLPQTGIKLVSVVLHSHLAGKKIRLHHIREGHELPHIAEDNSYDFNYQQSRILPHEVAVLPGDELVTECVYQTPKRTEPTFVSTVAFMSTNTSFSVAINIGWLYCSAFTFLYNNWWWCIRCISYLAPSDRPSMQNCTDPSTTSYSMWHIVVL
jgi:hypothetical protein